MSIELLNIHKIIWQEKPVLRAIYHDYYQRILKLINQGNTLEIGGGTGNLKDYLPNVISTDILRMPWLDVSCNAEALPFADGSFDNIIAIDVLHHIEIPMNFFKEAQRVLKPGGKIIMLEPAITKISWIFYHFFHPEPVILNSNPFLIDKPSDPNKEPFDANQAIPELIFGKFYQQFRHCFPKLILQKKKYCSLWAYPLSGGFRKWCLIPHNLVKFLLKIEYILENILAKHIGFRILIAIERVK